jgi:hypothetical protein
MMVKTMKRDCIPPYSAAAIQSILNILSITIIQIYYQNRAQQSVLFPIFYFLFDADNSVSASFTVSSESYVRYSEKAFEALFIIFFKSLVLTFSDLNSTK